MEVLTTEISKEKIGLSSSDMKTPKQKSNRGRKAESGNVRLEPIFCEEPDIEKLGRALIAMAVHAVNVEMEDKQKG